ncbi:cyclin-dependent kinase inhibitor 1B-like [Megalops cyprinoides]|uniref:cyclin-dependent kinase inhibitor 1B-like n=1 Tax=Megalops cyprinoides TaxID=118141 RepID=UPI0018640902|nr:cyclin-dependent kinase inhibitor 1B-like [Megalops cyprinoides]
MSNVRLSNGSPTLERMDGGLSDNPKPSFCRNLFGSVDHEELRRDLKQHLQEMEQASSAEWNFDFKNDEPLPAGRYQWERVNSRDLPDFYSRQPPASKNVCRSGNNNVDLNGNHNCMIASHREDSIEDRLSKEKTEKSESQMDCRDQCSGQRKRPASHDSSCQNKRSHTSSDEVARCPVLTHSVEHTPRKSSPKAQT